MGMLLSSSNTLMENYLLVSDILLVRCNNDHRHDLVHRQVINDDIVLIIYYQLLHLVIVHRALPNDHHHQQVRFY
jgi:hypothetical protein